MYKNQLVCEQKAESRICQAGLAAIFDTIFCAH